MILCETCFCKLKKLPAGFLYSIDWNSGNLTVCTCCESCLLLPLSSLSEVCLKVIEPCSCNWDPSFASRKSKAHLFFQQDSVCWRGSDAVFLCLSDSAASVDSSVSGPSQSFSGLTLWSPGWSPRSHRTPHGSPLRPFPPSGWGRQQPERVGRVS